MFIMVLIVFLLAYGISSQGLLYHSRSPGWDILKDVIYFPYWQLYGEIFLEELDSKKYITSWDGYSQIKVWAGIYEPLHEKTCLRDFPSGQTQTAQPQKLGRGLKFRILKLEVLYYLGRE